MIISLTEQSQFILSNIAIFSGVATGILGLVVYFKEPRNAAAVAYFYLSLSFAAWSVAIGVLFGSPVSLRGLIAGHMTFYTSLFMPFTLFCFATVLRVSDRARRRKAILWGSIPLVITFLTGFIPDFQIVDVVAYQDIGERLIYGPGTIYYAAFLLSYVALSGVLFKDLYDKHAGVFRSRYRYMLIIPVVTALIVFVADLVLDYMGIPDLIWVGAAALFVGDVWLGYMFARLRLWDLKLVSTEFFTAMVVLILAFDTIYAELYFEFFLKLSITVLVLLASIFLIRSVRREIRAKEEVKDLLDDLSDAHRKLQILDRNKSEFIESASRNLRDPLLAIQGYASLFLEDSFPNTGKKMREAVQKIHDSTKRLLVIIGDFMDVSKIETGQMEYDYTRVNVSELLSDLVDEMTFAAQKKDIELSFAYDEETDYEITADYGKVRQVLSNLIDNAIKYTPEGSVTVSVNGEGNAVHVVITDSGIGMEKETLDKIFAKFSRAEDVSKLYTEGSGLGLYVAREIVEHHGGDIWAESDGKGEGSEFHVRLPREPV